MHYSSAERPRGWEGGGLGGVSEGQSQWAEDTESSRRMWGVRGAGSLDKLTVLDWLWGRVADVGINFISLLFAPRLYRPLLRREEKNQLDYFDHSVSRECVTSLYSSLNFKLHSVAATSLGFKSRGFFFLLRLDLESPAPHRKRMSYNTFINCLSTSVRSLMTFSSVYVMLFLICL